MDKYGPEVKGAVLAALLTGQSVSSVAREYKIPIGTVKSWSARRRPQPDATDPTTKKEIGELLLRYLKQALETLLKQQVFFGDVTWLRRQSASELAVLHGVTADKTIRLLEALSANEQEPGVPAVAEEGNA